MTAFTSGFTSGDIPDLSRVTYFDGERLAAADLNDAATVQRGLRWLHNRSLHSWGIGLGFAVNGAKGDRQVQISPGYAIDCRGRELILTETLSKPVPATAAGPDGKAVTYYLVAAYPDDSTLTPLERRQGECGSDGVLRLREQADIYWKPAKQQSVEQGVEIVLAQASVFNCQLNAPLSVEQRRSARPPQQPYVAAGQSNTSTPPWQLWQVGGDVEFQTLLGVTGRVDTSSGRFGSTPQYQARLAGKRFFLPVPATDGQPFLLDGLTFVDEPAPDGFTFRVVLPRDMATVSGGGGSVAVNPSVLFNQSTQFLSLIQAEWSVVWVGVEG